MSPGRKVDRKLALFLSESRNTKINRCIVKYCDDQFIQFLGEIALNVLQGTVEISSYYLTTLTNSAPVIRYLASSKVTVKKRRSRAVKEIVIVCTLVQAVKEILY
jgi:hypothetical protein